MRPDHKIALAEISSVLDGIDSESIDEACRMIGSASTLLLYGCGREGLQMRGLTMRLYHLGLKANMVADMAAPPLGKGDLLIVSAGPGELASVTALMKVAKRDGAQVLFFTAAPDTPAALDADHIVSIPAQTMANDQDESSHSILPMGSVYEGGLFILFEMMILQLIELLQVDPDTMRARHTNME